MSNKPIFLEYDAQQEEQNLVELFENMTGKPLYPAQDERLLISIIEYKAALLVNLFNETAKLNLTQYSKGVILDCIGEMFDTPRLEGEYGTDILQITLNTTFESDLTIPKGLEILSKDEKTSFITTEDLIISAGETVGNVNIQAKEIGSAVNVYGAGDVTILVKPVSYIESVTNLNGVSGGTDKENDEAYIKRILLAPEKFSCAGSRQSYIYHTLSANNKIIDATAESVEHPAKISIKENGDTTVYTEENGEIVTDNFTATTNHKTGEVKFTLDDKEYTVQIQPDTTVNIYPLTNDDTTPNEVLQDVEDLLNGEKINPMTDKIIVSSPVKVDKSITLNIFIDEKADYETLSSKINDTIDEYKQTMRRTLNAQIIPSQIISRVGSIDGVFSVDTGVLTQCSADINEFFNISFTVNITQ